MSAPPLIKVSKTDQNNRVSTGPVIEPIASAQKSSPAVVVENVPEKAAPPKLEKVEKDSEKAAPPKLEKVEKAAEVKEPVQVEAQVITDQEVAYCRNSGAESTPAEISVHGTHSKFKVVSRITPGYWELDWVEEMDNLIGKVGVLRDRSETDGILLSFKIPRKTGVEIDVLVESHEFWFPKEALEDVSDSAVSLEVSRVIDNRSSDQKRQTPVIRKLTVPEVSYLLFGLNVYSGEHEFITSLPSKEFMFEACKLHLQLISESIKSRGEFLSQGTILLKERCRDRFPQIAEVYAFTGTTYSSDMDSAYRPERLDENSLMYIWYLVVSGVGRPSNLNLDEFVTQFL